MPVRRFVLSLLLASFVGMPNTASAQEEVLIGWGALSIGAIVSLAHHSRPAMPVPGARVRLRFANPPAQMLAGRLTALDADSITIEPDSTSPRRIARSDVAGMKVNVGRRGRWADGWAIGLGSGALLGAAAGYSTGDDDESDFFYFTRAEKAGLGAVAGAFVGSSVGALIGLAGPDRWVDATGFDARGRVAVVPIVGPRMGLSASIRF
jgi:hypothetical protein